MTLTFPSAIRPSLWSRLRRSGHETGSETTESYDGITGLLTRDAFLKTAGPLVELASREMREVAVVSILVGGIDVAESNYDEESRNELLGAFGAQLSDQMSPDDVVGRVGLAEFVWVRMIESRGAGWRYLSSVRAEASAAVASQPQMRGADYHFGFTLSRGRDNDIVSLIDEARRSREERAAA